MKKARGFNKSNVRVVAMSFISLGLVYQKYLKSNQNKLTNKVMLAFY